MNPVIRRAHPGLPLTVRKPAGIDVKEVRESEKNIRLDLPCIAGKPLRDGGLRDAILLQRGMKSTAARIKAITQRMTEIMA